MMSFLNLRGLANPRQCLLIGQRKSCLISNSQQELLESRWCWGTAALRKDRSLLCRLQLLLSPSSFLPHYLANLAPQSGLCSDLMWNLRNICSFLFQENDLRDWMWAFFFFPFLSLAVKLWSCPVWFFWWWERGFEVLFIRISCNKTFGLVSLLWPPSPPRPTTQCHLFCWSGKKHTLFPLQWLHCYLHTHGEKRPLCLSVTKAVLTVAQWRTRGSVYCFTERKRDPLGGESAFVLLWERDGLLAFPLEPSPVSCSSLLWVSAAE